MRPTDWSIFSNKAKTLESDSPGLHCTWLWLHCTDSKTSINCEVIAYVSTQETYVSSELRRHSISEYTAFVHLHRHLSRHHDFSLPPENLFDNDNAYNFGSVHSLFPYNFNINRGVFLKNKWETPGTQWHMAKILLNFLHVLHFVSKPLIHSKIQHNYYNTLKITVNL